MEPVAELVKNKASASPTVAVRDFIGQAIVRISHLERMLLGIATLGFLGWGVLYSGKLGDAQSGVAFNVFAILFSAMISCSYSSLFVGRISVNKSLLQLERYLREELSIPRQGLLYQGFFHHTSKASAAAIYITSALFLPLMSLSSLTSTALSVLGGGEFFKWPISGNNALWAVALLCSAVSVIGMAIVNVVHIVRLLEYAYDDHAL